MQVPTEAHARLIAQGPRILDAKHYGLDGRDRAELTRLLATPEGLLGARRIDELFSAHFFKSNFWQMWRTTFAFQNWHSAIELRRYFLRFLQEFPRMHTLAGVRRTPYNQYDSIAVFVGEFFNRLQRQLRNGIQVALFDLGLAPWFIEAGRAGLDSVGRNLEHIDPNVDHDDLRTVFENLPLNSTAVGEFDDFGERNSRGQGHDQTCDPSRMTRHEIPFECWFAVTITV